MVNWLIKRGYYFFVPFCLRARIRRFRYRKEINFSKMSFKRQEEYFRAHLNVFMYDDARKADILRVFSLLWKNGFATFPEMDDFIREKYFTRKLKIEKDLATGLFYVLVDNKKLFFKKDMDESSVGFSFNAVSYE
jgi:hypothetical protein